ncbi:MAG TPA: Crp/Fnr family transcriptional regulator [Polyangia bacterium]|nr:Crp/Fnr family transcriptional regulator [Polyangia bacterium]
MADVPIEVLQRIPLFRHLDVAALSALCRLVYLRRCVSGEEVVQQGLPSDAVYIIVKGRASVSVAARDGRILTLREIGEAEIIGEVSLLDGGLPSATVTAITSLELVVVERQSFLNLVEERPKIGVSLLAVLASRLRRLTAWADDLAGLPLSARIAKCLLGLVAAHGQELGPSRIRIGRRLSQGDLASMVGATRESVNKHLGRLEREGILAKENGYLVVLDLPRLQVEAQQD